MAELGEEQRDAEGHGPAEAEQVRKGREKALPVPRHQKHPEPQGRRQAVAQQARAEALQPGPGAIEESIRAPQGNAEKQILMQRHLPQALARRGGFPGVAGALLRVQRGDQVMGTQKAQQLLQLRVAQRQARFTVRRLQHLRRIPQRPMPQQTHGLDTELEITPAHRVGQGPARRTVQRRGGGSELQIRAQAGQVHYSPTLWRSPANGRRSRYKASGARWPKSFAVPRKPMRGTGVSVKLASRR